MTDGIYDPGEWLTPAERAAAVTQWNAPAGEGEFDALMRRWGEGHGMLPRRPDPSPETEARLTEERRLGMLARRICALFNAARPFGRPRIDAYSVLAFLRKERRPDKETARIVARVAEQVGWPADGINFLRAIAGVPL